MRHRNQSNIRVCSPNDAAIVADIVRRSYSRRPLAEVPDDMPIYHPESHAEAMKDTQTRWHILEDCGAPIGISMWRSLPSLAHLHLLFVVGERQGEGFGSLLLKHFHETAREEDPSLRLLTLHCLADSHRTMRFYRRHGYTQYSDGDEGHVIDLYLWLDAAKRDDTSWPVKRDKALLYKLVR